MGPLSIYTSPTEPLTEAGFSLVEITVSALLLSLFLLAATVSLDKIQCNFAQSQRMAWLSMRAEYALEQLTELCRGTSRSAIPSTPSFAPKTWSAHEG